MDMPIYSAVGDVITVMLYIICWLLLRSTYTMKQTNLKLFYCANSLIGIAAISHSFFYYILANINTVNVKFLYVLHCIVYICLASVLVLYCVYLCNLFELKRQTTRKLYWVIFSALILFVLYTIISSILKVGFHIDENLRVHYDYKLNVFICYYLYLSIIIVAMIYKLRQRLITKTRKCMQSIVIASFLVMFLGHINGSSSFICISFLFPVIAVLFFFHYNAYDTNTGTLDYKSFDNYIKHVEKPFGIVCLYLKDFHIENNKKLSRNFIEHTEKIFKNYCIFRISDSKIFLVYTKKDNLPDEQLMKKITENFRPLYLEYKIPYKLVQISSDSRLNGGDDYIALYSYLEKTMELNSFYRCKEEDIECHLKVKSVKNLLFDICNKKDMDDDRVLIYVQPIYNIRTKKYTNAEVLMRLKMDDEIIMPNMFIPIAEKNNYTYELTKILVNKTCKKIQDIINEGYSFDKISMNLSTVDLKDSRLYEEIMKIIRPYKDIKNKISFEITESEDGDYDNINNIINKFRNDDITFYLDDFGTSYSNLHRIFALKIDMIKLDKSLIKIGHKSVKDYSIIKSFIEMLKKAGYKILFEGVETLDDELMCFNMKVDYLQGYKYSKPIEFDQIRNFFVKEEK